MIPLDQVTLSAVTALVVIVCSVYFIVETLARRDEGAGRVWSLAFLGAMLTSLSYIVWAADPDVVWGVLIGNAAFIASTGCMWLGCRRFNGRRMTVPSVAVAAGAVGGGIAVAVAGPDAGAWAGALWMFLCLMVFAAFGAVEAVRGDMGRYRTARGLAFVLGLQALFYLVRSAVAVFAGFDSPVFLAAFGTPTTSVLTVVLMIVALVVTSVLRADRAAERGPLLASSVIQTGTDGILPRGVFVRLLEQSLARAAVRAESVAVVSVRIDDLPQIASAFGAETAREAGEAARTSVVRAVSSLALIGEDGADGLLLAVRALSQPDARRQAEVVYRGLMDQLGALAGGIVPAVGVGAAWSGSGAAEAGALVETARDAARRAVASIDTSVLVVDAAGVSAP